MNKLIALIDSITGVLQGVKPWLEKTGGVAALFDKSAWLLMAPALAGLYAVDPAMAETLVQWTLFALALAGAAVIVSRIVFPQISIGEMVEAVRTSGGAGPGIVVAAVVLFVGIVFLGMVIWAKA